MNMSLMRLSLFRFEAAPIWDLPWLSRPSFCIRDTIADRTEVADIGGACEHCEKEGKKCGEEAEFAHGEMEPGRSAGCMRSRPGAARRSVRDA